MAGWLLPALGFAGALGASLINRDSQEDTNDTNVHLWREQAAYNTPANQMARLQAAGLNPNLAYGQIAESRMSNPPTMQAPQFEAPDTMGALTQYQQVKNLQVLNARNNIELEKARADAIKAASDADYTVWENQKLKSGGIIKSDPGYVKAVGRGLDVAGDYLIGVVRRTNEAIRAPWKLMKYVGPDEQAHRLVGPVPMVNVPDGGQ